MGAAFRRFCASFCCCCCCEEEEPEEKAPLLNETLLYFDREAKKRRDQETNLWSEPRDPSHSERDDDRELYNLLQKRAKTRRGSQGYRRLSVDINAVRQVRHGVKEKWKMILENLGFMEEAESLLTVSSTDSYDRMRNAPVARSLLQTLYSETSIFRSKEPPPERYMFILEPLRYPKQCFEVINCKKPKLVTSRSPTDRLIYLDAADEFVAKARRFYPKGEEDDDDDEPAPNLPLLVTRASLNTAGNEDGLDEEEASGADVEDDIFDGKSLD